MRMSAPTPTVDPLPYFARDPLPPRAPGQARPAPPDTRVVLRGDAIARFDALLHEIHADAPRVDPDRLQHLVDWLLALPPARAHDVLDRRLQRIDSLRAMIDDSDWNTDDATHARILKLLDYIDREDDLIADHESMLGLLDDVLLLELAWPVFADEAEEYRDFCRYRDDEHPTGTGDVQRSAWIRDRIAEINLWQHQLRVHGSHYAQSGEPPLRFRVG